MSIHIGIIAYGIHYMRTSELFLGKRCMEIYISDYVTECLILRRKIFVYVPLPKE